VVNGSLVVHHPALTLEFLVKTEHGAFLFAVEVTGRRGRLRSRHLLVLVGWSLMRLDQLHLGRL